MVAKGPAHIIVRSITRTPRDRKADTTGMLAACGNAQKATRAASATYVVSAPSHDPTLLLDTGLFEGGPGRPLGIDRQQLSPRQAQGELDDAAFDPGVALHHVWRQVAERIIQDVLAGGPPCSVPGDHGLQPAEASTRILFHLLPCRYHRAEPFQLGLRVAEAVENPQHS